MVRPIFQGSQSLRVFYAVVTWVGTTIVVIFNGTGFQLLYYDKIAQVQLWVLSITIIVYWLLLSISIINYFLSV